MLKGRYTNTPIDFEKWEMERVRLSIYNNNYSYIWGCGPNALALLVNKSPKTIFYENDRKTHYSDDLMVNYLRKHKFKILPLTIANLSNSKFVENKLTERHLILLSQIFKRQEASWSILLGLKLLIHNMAIEKLGCTEFLERSLLSCFLVFNPAWKV